MSQVLNKLTCSEKIEDSGFSLSGEGNEIFQCYSMVGCGKRWGLTRTDLKKTISLLVDKVGGSSILGSLVFPDLF